MIERGPILSYKIKLPIKALGMSQVFVHWYGGVLSAYGMALVDAVHEEQEPTAEVYSTKDGISDRAKERLQFLANKASQALVGQGYELSNIVVEEYLNMRYEGTDNAIMIQREENVSFDQAFEALYLREFLVSSCRDGIFSSMIIASVPSFPAKHWKFQQHLRLSAYRKHLWAKHVPFSKMVGKTLPCTKVKI